MGMRLDEVELRVAAVAVADGERPTVRAERECSQWADDRAEVADLSGCLEARADLAQRPRVEKRHAPVVGPESERPTVVAERVVEDALPAAVQDCERRRAAQKRGEQI